MFPRAETNQLDKENQRFRFCKQMSLFVFWLKSSHSPRIVRLLILLVTYQFREQVERSHTSLYFLETKNEFECTSFIRIHKRSLTFPSSYVYISFESKFMRLVIVSLSFKYQYWEHIIHPCARVRTLSCIIFTPSINSSAQYIYNMCISIVAAFLRTSLLLTVSRRCFCYVLRLCWFCLGWLLYM